MRLCKSIPLVLRAVPASLFLIGCAPKPDCWAPRSAENEVLLFPKGEPPGEMPDVLAVEREGDFYTATLQAAFRGDFANLHLLNIHIITPGRTGYQLQINTSQMECDPESGYRRTPDLPFESPVDVHREGVTYGAGADVKLHESSNDDWGPWSFPRWTLDVPDEGEE